jgi:heme/copper-type cytochrome/quinol oxidase subunit 1
MTIMSGVYYWFPKMTGKMMSEKLGNWHFWTTFVFLNLTFFPMHFMGLMGMPRRIADYNPIYTDLNVASTIGAIGFGVVQIILIYNVFYSLKKGKDAPANPWGGETLEWTVPSPPTEHNFEKIPVVK